MTLGQADLQGYRLAAGRAKAERALAINPHYAPAHVLLADLNISDERFHDALAAARKAVAENPRDEDALARLAASCRLLVDPVGAAAAEADGPGQQPPPRHLLRRAGRAAGRPPQVPLGRARLPAGRRRRPHARRRPDRPGHALHADRPRDRGQRPLRRGLRRRPVQRPRRQHDEGAQAHGVVHARRDRALQRLCRPHPGRAPGQVHGAVPRVGLRRADRAGSATPRRA